MQPYPSNAGLYYAPASVWYPSYPPSYTALSQSMYRPEPGPSWCRRQGQFSPSSCYTLPPMSYAAAGGFQPVFLSSKPALSYVGLISEAILSSAEKKVLLSDIYEFLLMRYPYFRTRTTGWRNSIRHNLSLNPCFVKLEKSTNGKGHFWSIHEDFLEDFIQGKFKKRSLKQSVREPEDDKKSPVSCSSSTKPTESSSQTKNNAENTCRREQSQENKKKAFDIASLLSSGDDHKVDQ